MADPYDVVVAIPARDEASRIEKCLSSVVTAVNHARAGGAVGRVSVAVAADRCRDDTAELAGELLGSLTSCAGLILETSAVIPVGGVRSRLIGRALTDHAGDPSRCWIFSTDADTVVPPDWITAGLQLAEASSAVLVAGLVDLDPLEVHPRVRLAHDQLVRAGIHADGSHDHVYAANLAIRADAYAALGGFPAVIKGEEQALLDASRLGGHAVLTTTSWRVQTSARLRARAQGGLGDLLRWLTEDEERAG